MKAVVSALAMLNVLLTKTSFSTRQASNHEDADQSVHCDSLFDFLLWLFNRSTGTKATRSRSSRPKKLCSTHHHGIWKKFVDGWLNGNAPPPDVSETDNSGVTDYAWVAYCASMTGLLIAQGLHK
jgi:hypothetical protein